MMTGSDSQDPQRTPAASSGERGRKPAPPSSVLLLRRIHEEGSETAWRELTHKYQDELHRYAAQVIGPRLRRRVDPGDLFQRAFLRTLPRFVAGKERESGSFRGLLKMTIRRLAAEEGRLKGEGRVRTEADEDAEEGEASAELGGTPASPLSLLALEETLQELRQAVEGLPKLYRDVVTAIDLEGRDAAEVAAARAVNPDTLRRQLNRGRERLRLALEAARGGAG